MPSCQASNNESLCLRLLNNKNMLEERQNPSVWHQLLWTVINAVSWLFPSSSLLLLWKIWKTWEDVGKWLAKITKAMLYHHQQSVKVWENNICNNKANIRVSSLVLKKSILQYWKEFQAFTFLHSEIYWTIIKTLKEQWWRTTRMTKHSCRYEI